MLTPSKVIASLVLAMLISLVAPSPAPATAPAGPETVIVTFRPKDGKEDAVRALIEKQWTKLVELKLVKPDSHQFYRGEPESGGKIVFVDIFTWLSGDIPDNAPKEIQEIWTQMQDVTESRDGRAPIAILVVTRLDADRRG